MKGNIFPRGFFHYRDDYDDDLYVTNVSNFDLIDSVDNNNDAIASITKLMETASRKEQEEEAQPTLPSRPWMANILTKDSTTAPEPVVEHGTDTGKQVKCGT